MSNEPDDLIHTKDLTKLVRGFQGTSCKERTRPLVQSDS